MPSAWMWVDNALARQLEAFRTAINGDGNWTLALYQNNKVPAAGDNIGMYTQATFTGYTPKLFLPSGFQPVTVVANVAQTIHSLTQSFTMTGGSNQTIYGYYLLDATGGFIGAEMFAASLLLTPGGTINVRPKLRHGIMPP